METLNERNNKGIRAGFFGIFCNVFLSITKYIVGTMTYSFSIKADAINNISDSLSSIITIIGFKLAAKPADKEHPYGHERFEYIGGFIISIIMMYLGIDILKSSIKDIFKEPEFIMNKWTVGVLVVSILVKFIMMVYYNRQAKIIDSDMLIANAQDSRNDILMTSSILIALVIQFKYGFRFDTYMAIVIAVFIIYSSVRMIMDFIDEILGTRPDDELLKEIKRAIDERDNVLGFHDLRVFKYGNFHVYGVVHVELDSRLSLTEGHTIIDEIERDIIAQTNAEIVIHLDPIDREDPKILYVKKEIKKFLNVHYPKTTIHDLRFIHEKLYFEVFYEGATENDVSELKKELIQYLKNKNINHEIEITIDTDQLI